MDEIADPRREQYLAILDVIASEQNAWSDWLKEMGERTKQKPTRSANILSKKYDQETKKKAESTFKKLMHEYAQGEPINGFHPFDGRLNMRSPDHHAKKLQERYLLIKLDITQIGTSSENWSAIGMALANKETNLMKVINPPERKEKRGRRSNGVSVDYERAVWKYSVDKHIWDVAFSESENVEYDEVVKVTLYSTSELIDAFLFGLKNPDSHKHIHILKHLEKRLKLSGKSKASLLVGFNRGEKQRDALWDD